MKLTKQQAELIAEAGLAFIMALREGDWERAAQIGLQNDQLNLYNLTMESERPKLAREIVRVTDSTSVSPNDALTRLAGAHAWCECCKRLTIRQVWGEGLSMPETHICATCAINAHVASRDVEVAV